MLIILRSNYCVMDGLHYNQKMNLIYCTHSLCNPGGMERVLVNKVTYLVNRLHWDIMIVKSRRNGTGSGEQGDVSCQQVALGHHDSYY